MGRRKLAAVVAGAGLAIAAAPVASPDRHVRDPAAIGDHRKVGYDKHGHDWPARTPADRVHDQAYARQAVLKREVLPMPRLLSLVGGYQGGDVIEVELKSRADRLFYDVDVLSPSGQVHSLQIDARDGRLIANRAKG